MNTSAKTALIVLGAIVLPIAATAYCTFASVVSAPGRVVSKTLDTNNIINSYEWYFDNRAAFNARKNQVAQFKSILAESEGGERGRVRMELAAMQQTCRTLAEQYNANSQKLNKGLFKDWSLPETLNAGECE